MLTTSNLRNYLILLILCILNSTVFALTSYAPECPLKITTQQQLKKTPRGWSGFNPEGNYFLDSVSFYSGDPKELASLKPDIMTPRHSVWSFSPQDTVYILCEYNQTVIGLTKKLPAGVIDCEVINQEQVRGSKGAIPGRIICHVQ